MLGVSAGIGLMMLALGLGINQAFDRVPVLYPMLNVFSIAYLLYMAWRIGTSDRLQRQSDAYRPMKFREAIAFQWINPKAWIMVFSTSTMIL